MRRLIVCGSPRARGRSAALAEGIRAAYEQACPDDDTMLLSLADVRIAPCTGCGVCEHAKPGRDELYCVIADDMARVRALLNECDHICLVSPVYFAGAPAQLKAFLDRLQPYFWTDRRLRAKRPADLYVVGEGGDPHGFGPLVGTVRSAFAVAGFRLDSVHDWVGLLREGSAFPADADALRGGRVHPASSYVCSGPNGIYPQPTCSTHATADLEGSR